MSISRNLSIFADTVSTSGNAVTAVAFPTHTSASSLTFQTNGTTTAMTIDASQNVGIGTSSPGALLHVSNIAAAIRIGTTAISQYTDIYRDGLTGFTIYNAAQAAPYRSHIWQLGGTEAARIDSSGNLLVGTTTSSAKLTVVGGGIGPTEYLKQTTAGSYVSIFDAVINGATYYLVNFYAAGTQTGGISSNGTLTIYSTSSDIRLKENIVDAPSALPTLAKLQVRSFDWKSGPHHKFGFIAQEVVEVDPNAVAKGPTEDDMWAIDNSVLVPMLIKAVQELSAKVTALESR